MLRLIANKIDNSSINSLQMKIILYNRHTKSVKEIQNTQDEGI